MNLFNLSAALVSLAALFAWINFRLLRLPTTIGVMMLGVLSATALLAANHYGFSVGQGLANQIRQIDFNELLMQGMLSFLLFAGALHVKLQDLSRLKWTVGLLASVGTVASTFLVGYVMHWMLGVLGITLPLIYCFLFGALISPTDPIAVLGILKTAGVQKDMQTAVSGESLFNDGIGVVVFLVIAGLAASGAEPDFAKIGLLFAEEALGGLVFGFVIGHIALRMMRGIDNYQVEVLVTLALVMGGYALALRLHVSGPLAMVVAGLIIGNHGRDKAMSQATEKYVDLFWELVDEILNVMLFLLLGLELLVITLQGDFVRAGLYAIPLVLLVRMFCVAVPLSIFGGLRQLGGAKAIPILTWAGLRGGISVALALSLPLGPERDVILTMTYCVVVFSIVVQGMTVGPLVRALSRRG